ncbi:cyclophane-forming radical SAM peptide maturase AmcB [Streptomyces roseifaciens]|uniref:cyclophane-forming radical SAM peptide maturase AmcB n=1 Tax=Streptomyces roseifaciens TaxID=1488406 RepID=UPI0007180189|nr:cyclophane-forming radical SAM peptide maturase AmcB [Streptomyces roseifaciens]
MAHGRGVGACLAATSPLVFCQPTTLCNLDCAYCYLPERTERRRMSVEVADAVSTAVSGWSRLHPVRVLWHGGEPLATGLEHFSTLLDRFEPGHPHPVRHAVQTNATLIDDAWCEMLADRGVEVTVSIDGPGADNARRPDRAGRSSTERTLAGIGRLRSHGVPFGVLAVVSDPTPVAAERLYRFVRDLEARALGVNLAEHKGVHRRPGPRAEAADFWAALAGAWRADPVVPIRDFDQAFGYLRDELAGTADDRAGRPFSPLPLITWDGDVVPLSPDLAGFSSLRHGPFTAGNLRDAPLDTLLAHAPELPWVREALDGIRNCRITCDHFAYCRGGQAANKYFETGRLDTTVTDHCHSSKIQLMEGLLRHARPDHRPHPHDPPGTQGPGPQP